MAKEYKVNVDGREIIYGALVRDDDRLSVKEWDTVAHEMVKQNLPEEYEKYKDDEDVIDYISSWIDIRERYEALMELLPQSLSYFETSPYRIAEEVYDNTFEKDIVQYDVQEIINRSADLEELKGELVAYFNLKEVENETNFKSYTNIC